MRRSLIGITLFMILLSLACNKASNPEEKLELEKHRSSLELVLYQGEEQLGTNTVNTGDLYGQPIILNFWAVSCSPCRTEMPALERFHQAHKNEILLLGVDVGRSFFGDSPEEARRFLAEKVMVTYPVGYAPDSLVALEEYGVFALPHTIFISPTGEILKEWTGAITEEKLTEIAQELF